MCGIFGAVLNQNSASDLVYAGLQRLEYRGYDSWGMAVIKEGEIQQERRVGAISQNLSLALPKAKAALGHTRWATHGKINRENTHPHLAKSKNFTLVHNGVVQNVQALKADLLTEGYKFSSETDSEVILALIENELAESDQSYPTAKTLIKISSLLTGRNSIAVLTEQEEILALNLGSPLLIGRHEQGYFIASDQMSLTTIVSDYVPLKSGQVVQFGNEQSLNIFQSIDQKIKPEWQKCLVNEQAFELKAAHYMIKEIEEQPEVLYNVTYQSRKKIKCLMQVLKKARCVYFVGAGSAGYAADQCSFWWKQKGINARSISVYGIREEEKFFSADDLVIAFSQSGETADTIRAVEFMKARGLKVVSLINMQGSSLERISDLIFSLRVGPELAVASTKALTGQLVWGQLICQLMTDMSYQQVQDDLEKYCIQLKEWLDVELKEKIEKIVEALKEKQHLFVLGLDQFIYPAREVALKIKEVSYAHAEAFIAGELKHGVIALIEKNTPVLYLASQKENHDDLLNAAIEVKSRGARLIGLTDFSNSVFDDWLRVDFYPRYQAISMIIVGQLLAYKLSILKGFNPDKPRNLAKSVTVN